MMIFGIGTVVVDHVVELATFPTEDSKREVKRHWTQVGGPVPVALSTTVAFGAHTAFLGRWGNDTAGDYIHHTLKERKIELSECSSDAAWSSGFAHVWVNSATGTRTIAYSRGNFPLPQESDVSETVVSTYPILHLDGWAADAAIKAATIVKANGGTVVLDAGSAKPRMDELLPLVDVLIASKLFRQSRFGQADVSKSELLALGPTSIISTDGANGATWVTRDQEIREPALSIEAVDTNGAGDIFSGGILQALRTHQKPRVALRFANRIAGQSCLRRGNSAFQEK